MVEQTATKLYKTLENWVIPIQDTGVHITKEFNKTSPVEEYIRSNYNEAIYNFLAQHVGFHDSTHLFTNTATRFNILKEPKNYYSKITNLRRINDIRYLNKFFETVNSRLPKDGIFISWVETKKLRKERILKKFPKGFNYIFYTIDFIFKRIFPKLPVTKKIYFFITRGHNRVLSRAETLGRLVSCGFVIKEQKFIDGKLFFICRKVQPPLYPAKPTYGPLITLNRVGKHGKIIKIYKLRTMHPFSEYIQEYVYSNNNFQKNGKFKNDFRVCTAGRLLRKYWIDELPMFINFFKGELKFVGVRPISQHYFDLYPENLQKRRIQYKPGLFPPFYADLPKTFEGIIESERKYLEQYERSPLKTDWIYFWKIFCNIVFKSARSS